MDVTTHNIEIPAGKVRVKEPRDMTPEDRRAVRHRITSGEGRIGRVYLDAVEAGYVCAGSMMRWDNGHYSVWFEHDGSRHSRMFKSETDARDLFTKWTVLD